MACAYEPVRTCVNSNILTNEASTRWLFSPEIFAWVREEWVFCPTRDGPPPRDTGNLGDFGIVLLAYAILRPDALGIREGRYIRRVWYTDLIELYGVDFRGQPVPREAINPLRVRAGEQSYYLPQRS